MNKKQQLYSVLTVVCLGLSPLYAQSPAVSSSSSESRHAWEFGVGGTMINWNRVSITGFQSTPDHYLYDLRVDHLMGGPNLYVAYELNPWLYLDVQGTLGLAEDRTESSGSKYNIMALGGAGVQLRLSPLFQSKYVEPYLRAGINYLYKDFSSITTGVFSNDVTGQARWESTDIWNRKGSRSSKNSFFPASFGAGVNGWLNNRFGLGLQGEYLIPLERDLPRFAQVSLRVMYRLGGSDKRPAPVVHYETIERPVDRVIEKIVEREVVVPASSSLCDLLSNVHFAFDEYTLTSSSEEILDQLAAQLKGYEGETFLITGYTDARGSDSYNLRLSRLRARTVVEALEARGVPSTMLKSRGVGKRATSVPSSEDNEVRLGDRKVTIERVTNKTYWNRLPKHDA